MAYPFPADVALAISQKYADFCITAAKKLGVPRLSHPAPIPLAPGQRLRVAYVSSDFGNHPLSHLMGSVFGGHDRFKVAFQPCLFMTLSFRLHQNCSELLIWFLEATPGQSMV